MKAFSWNFTFIHVLVQSYMYSMCTYLQLHSVCSRGLCAHRQYWALLKTQSPWQVLPPRLCVLCSLVFICSTRSKVPSLLALGGKQRADAQRQDFPLHPGSNKAHMSGMARNGRCSMDGKTGSQLLAQFFLLVELRDSGCGCVTIDYCKCAQACTDACHRAHVQLTYSF